MGAFSGVALVLSVVGMFGALSNLVLRRRPELGVRAALGASPLDLRRLVLARAGLMLGAGTVGGLLIASLLGRLLAGLLFGVAPGDPVTLLAAAGTLALAGALASLVPSSKAGHTDPARLLNAE
jgi:ABC-type antimicrobial peptide transport system permease subunit